MSSAVTLTAQLAKYIVATDYTKIPDDVVDCTKRVLLDTLGCMVLGSTLPGGSIMEKYLRATGVVGNTTVIGSSLKTSTAYAALANGTSSHADELDASHKSWGHPASLSVAAALAVCEAAERSGRDLVNGVALSHDIGTRVFTAMGEQAGVAADAPHAQQCATLVGSGRRRRQAQRAESAPDAIRDGDRLDERFFSGRLPR